jgi:pyruvate dehydrogenase E1 component
VEVDFSTGSVGLGAAITTFSALIQEYIKHHGWQAGLQETEDREGRMIALVGDAEVSTVVCVCIHEKPTNTPH